MQVIRQPIKILRIVLGMLVGPMVPGLLFSIPDLFSRSPVGTTWFLWFAAVAGYPIGVILGIPMYRIYFKSRPVTFWRCVLIGLALGFIAYMSAFLVGLISADPAAGYALRTTIFLLPVSAFCGGLAAASFWLIARPDLYATMKTSN
jgi:hypothetical protein